MIEHDHQTNKRPVTLTIRAAIDFLLMNGRIQMLSEAMRGRKFNGGKGSTRILTRITL